MEAHLARVQVQLSPLLPRHPRPLRSLRWLDASLCRARFRRSLVIDVDLIHIRSVRGAIGVEEDITKPQCQAAIEQLIMMEDGGGGGGVGGEGDQGIRSKSSAVAANGNEEEEPARSGSDYRNSGRLIDLPTKCDIELDGVSILVLDEVDCMLQRGFHEQVMQIFRALSRPQVLMYSATIPKEVEKMASSVVKDIIAISVGRPNKPKTDHLG
ncbi:DEAD-box ATP-dependent RNA helicase 41 [Camellia lanceoleosa]|uniref:DEAD-box ATP-dependent RNA helicase 41 n=1 Tax=Camellia lanceoleosa TaxID=1840588 RepID=A0ACC0F6A5_9ERIC|nr:DEAD-box ATP-dependent RNA helicase 41 [Camellia lanceoleosa]